MRRTGERLADIIEAAESIAVPTAMGRAAFDADEDTQIVLLHLVQVIEKVAAAVRWVYRAASRGALAPDHCHATGSCRVSSRSIQSFCGTWRSSTCLSWPARFLLSNPGAPPARSGAAG